MQMTFTFMKTESALNKGQCKTSFGPPGDLLITACETCCGISGSLVRVEVHRTIVVLQINDSKQFM